MKEREILIRITHSTAMRSYCIDVRDFFLLPRDKYRNTIYETAEPSWHKLNVMGGARETEREREERDGALVVGQLGIFQAA